jgi:hypothetical protein
MVMQELSTQLCSCYMRCNAWAAYDLLLQVLFGKFGSRNYPSCDAMRDVI